MTPDALENLPGYPDVDDPEILAMDLEDDQKITDLEKPIILDDYRWDKTKEDCTYIRPEDMANMPPLTQKSLNEFEEIMNSTYVDDHPENQWLYEQPKGPFISIVTKREWGAKPTKKRQPLKLPVQYVRFLQTKTGTSNYPVCFDILLRLQKKQMDDGSPDINYNFMIGKEGQLYEGRGFYVDVEKPVELEHLKGNCLDIAYIGDFTEKNPPWEMVETGINAIRYCVETKVLSENYTVIPMEK